MTKKRFSPLNNPPQRKSVREVYPVLIDLKVEKGVVKGEEKER